MVFKLKKNVKDRLRRIMCHRNNMVVVQEINNSILECSMKYIAAVTIREYDIAKCAVDLNLENDQSAWVSIKSFVNSDNPASYIGFCVKYVSLSWWIPAEMKMVRQVIFVY